MEIQAAYLGEVARLARDLGTNMVRVFTGYERPGIPYDQQYATVVAGLRLAGQQAARYGVYVGGQNHHDIAISPEAMSWLLNEVNHPNVKLAWDAWSPTVLGLTPEQIRQSVLKLKPFIVHTTAAQYISVQRYRYLPDLVQYMKTEPENLEVPMGPGIRLRLVLFQPQGNRIPGRCRLRNMRCYRRRGIRRKLGPHGQAVPRIHEEVPVIGEIG